VRAAPCFAFIPNQAPSRLRPDAQKPSFHCPRRLWCQSARSRGNKERKGIMLSWSITFLIIALIAALLGFSGIAGMAAGFAKILFAVFLVLFVVSLLFGRKAV
jgi:uncharacterized membrane protein YtjA (UPF0391 family)